MKLRTLTTLFLLAVLLMPSLRAVSADGSSKKYNYVNNVDPWIESNKGRFFFFQSAKVPWGFVSLRPDDWVGGAWSSGYAKNKDYITGFSHLHDWQLAGIQIIPTTEVVSKTDGVSGWRSAVDHNNEQAEAGYHQLFLKRYNINAELTATERVGMHRYTYNSDGSSEIIIHLGGMEIGNTSFGEVRAKSSFFKKVGNNQIEGWIRVRGVLSMFGYNLYFSIIFDRPMSSLGAYNNKEVYRDITQSAGQEYSGAFARFDNLTKGDQIRIKVGVSLTSTDGACRNRIEEIPDSTWDFDKVRTDAQDKWEHNLSKIAVSGGTPKQRTKFYTDLFHFLCGRCIISDADGSYIDNTWEINDGQGVVRHVPMKDGKPEFNMYNYDALWLSQWNLNTVFGLAYPSVYNEFVQSQLQMYKDGGLLPRGPAAGNYTLVMTSAPVISFIAGAYNKNIRNYDADLAWEALSDAATIGGLYDKGGYEYVTWDGVNGAKEYITMGYVPHDMYGGRAHCDGAGSTLEYSFQDFALANFSKKLNKRGINIASLSKITASSELNDQHQAAQRAIDDRPARSGVYPVGVEWESNNESTPWIQLDFDTPRELTKIELFDRTSVYTQVMKGTLTFSDGSRIDVGPLPNEGELPISITINKKRISWVRFTVTESYGTNVGLNEMKVWDNTNAYQYYMNRSGNWKNLFDKQTNLIRPKGKDGSWQEPFDPTNPKSHSSRNNFGNDFVESNSWQCTFTVSHDIMGLAKEMGGAKNMADTLNAVFNIMKPHSFGGGPRLLNYGNQPGLSTAHTFNYIGYPWLTQYWVRRVQEQRYGATDADNGYGRGDEDQGQMGAISALMAMGLFQITGGCTERAIYDITSPIFDEVCIKLDNDFYPGKEFRIITHNNAHDNCYIQKATLNGKPLENCWFYHDDYIKGGTLELWLDKTPNINWGVKVLPPSVTQP